MLCFSPACLMFIILISHPPSVQRKGKGGREGRRESGWEGWRLSWQVRAFPGPAPSRGPLGFPWGGGEDLPVQSCGPHERVCKCWTAVSVHQMPQPDGEFLFCRDPRLDLFPPSVPLREDLTEWNCHSVSQEFGFRRYFQNMGPERKGRSKWPNKVP